MSAGRVVLAIVAGVAVTAAVLGVAKLGSSVAASDERQQALAPFYETPSPLPGPPGTLVRVEPLGVDVPGATALRMLYVSQRPDGSSAVSGGMVFVPDAPAPQGGRPVVAWAHGTIGQGDACAPSRSSNPLQDTGNWLDAMMQRGWLVVSTDYTGLGTAGPNLYLVGQAEASDIVHSVEAARAVEGADPSNRFIVWGHSQGGHSALWTGHLAHELAPDLDLVAVAAAAPAAELSKIIGAQWDTAAGWAIGPEVIDSWPVIDPQLPVDSVLTKAAQDNAERLSNECIVPAALEGLARTQLGQHFFSMDPLEDGSWSSMAQAQTPAPLPHDLPVLIGQSTSDTVVLGWPQAALQEAWCAAGSNLTMDWLGGVSHQQTATTMGPAAVMWMEQRFAGVPAVPNCAGAPPIAPTDPGN